MSLLPEKKTVPKQNFHEYTKVFYGAPGSGKTSVAAQNPNAVFIMFEDGIAGHSVFAINIPRIAKKQGKMRWVVFLDVVEELLTEDHNFNEVIIDTGDRAIDACADYTKEMEGIDNLSQKSFGAAWRDLFKYFKKPIEKLKMSELGFTLISHGKLKEVTDIQGRTHDKLVANMTGQSGQWIIDEADIVLLFDVDDDDNRMMRVEATKNFDAKQRIKFPDGDIPMGKNEKEAYKNLIDSFENAVKQRNKELGITKEQIKEYYQDLEEFKSKKSFKDLINDIAAKCQKLGLSKKDNAKEMKEKYGTPSLGKLTYEQAQDRVEELKGRL